MTELTEFVQCGICLEDYDSSSRVPRMLSCTHSMCQICLADMIDINKLECPICRSKFNGPLDAIPKNRYILQYIESLKGQQQTLTTTTTTTTSESSNNVDNNSNNNNNNSNNSNNNSNTNSSNGNTNDGQWDQKSYFKDIFDDIDHNGDGEINYSELREALIRGQPNSDFNERTVVMLLKKYDSNTDNEINFDEFFELFVFINNQYLDFLDFDQDFSGSISKEELTASLKRKGFQFGAQFYTFIVDEMAKRGESPITFDFYVRALVRIDILKVRFNNSDQNKFHGSSKNNRNQSLEYYIANNFFAIEL